MRDETILLRQINPAFIQSGKVTSQAFRPTPKDDNGLSVYDGDMISAEESYIHFRKSLKLSSVGVLGVSCAECNNLEITAYNDPAPYPQHCIIDFTPLETSRKRDNAAKKLRNLAEVRGWLFCPE